MYNTLYNTFSTFENCGFFYFFHNKSCYNLRWQLRDSPYYHFMHFLHLETVDYFVSYKSTYFYNISNKQDNFMTVFTWFAFLCCDKKLSKPEKVQNKYNCQCFKEILLFQPGKLAGCLCATKGGHFRAKISTYMHCTILDQDVWGGKNVSKNQNRFFCL